MKSVLCRDDGAATESRVIMGLSLAVVFALAFFITRLQVEAKKECIKIKHDILTLAKDTHLLVKFDKEFPSGDAEDQYKELCGRYEGTPTDRTSYLVIGHFGIDVYGDTDAKKKAMDVAKNFGADDENEWPTYVLMKKGITDPSGAIKFEGENTAEELAIFLREQVDITVGTMLYYIGTLDRMASRLMGVDENGGKKAKLEMRFYTYVAKIMIFLYRGDGKEVAYMYGKTMTNILKEGKEYVTKNKDRLDRMLTSDRNMSNLKREEIAQRLHILEKFTDPVEVSEKENRNFYFAVGWYTLLLGSMVLMIISMLFFQENEVKKEGVDGSETEPKKDQ